jgi:hypothetical protein
MKSSHKKYIIIITFYIYQALALWPGHAAAGSSGIVDKYRFPSTVELPAIAQQFEQKRDWTKPDKTEHHLPYSFNYGLRMALPAPLRNNFDFSGGFDKWTNLPIVKTECFVPVKAWPDKTIFFTPRINLTGRNECYSLGAGVRQLITSEMMIGFHTFYDWNRPRRSDGDYLREAGVGVEFSALPGHFSDLTVSANAYFPINTREEIRNNGVSMVKESLPEGGDARISLLLPPIISWLDLRLDASAHRYVGRNSNISGYRTALSVNSRDGMFNMTVDQGEDSRLGRNYGVTAGIRMAFDWNALLDARNPFSAPYHYSSTQHYNRKIRNSLFSKVNRKYDLPEDRFEQRSTLMASVMGDTVTFTGGFPNLPYSTLTVQVSQSPWQDYSEITTDDNGAYYGAISLPPGVCRLRVLHKPSGRVTEPKTVVITKPGIPSESDHNSSSADM